MPEKGAVHASGPRDNAVFGVSLPGEEVSIRVGLTLSLKVNKLYLDTFGPTLSSLMFCLNFQRRQGLLSGKLKVTLGQNFPSRWACQVFSVLQRPPVVIEDIMAQIVASAVVCRMSSRV